MDSNSKFVNSNSKFVNSNYKDTVVNLTTDFLNEHSKMTSGLTAVIDSLVSELSESCKNIESYKAQCESYKTLCETKDGTIVELRTKISSFTEETSSNKFDIIRGQSKEIAAKDKELVRLREELVKIKESSCHVNKMVGWSPTTSSTPTQKEEPPKIELASDKDSKDTDSTKDTYGTEDGTIESESDEEYEMITYRKNNYFLCGQKVYDIKKDLDGDDDIGKYIGTYVKQSSGKYKVVKD